MDISKINPNRFIGRSVLITGSGSKAGIGFATAELMLRSGARVVITSTTKRILERKAELNALGEVATFVVTHCQGWIKSEKHKVTMRLEPLRQPSRRAAQEQFCRKLTSLNATTPTGKSLVIEVGRSPLK